MAKTSGSLDGKVEQPYLVVLPEMVLDSNKRNLIEDVPIIGGTLATTNKGAVGQYLFRHAEGEKRIILPSDARLVQVILNQIGGTERFSRRIPYFSQTREEKTASSMKPGYAESLAQFRNQQEIVLRRFAEGIYRRQLSENESEIIFAVLREFQRMGYRNG